MSLAIKYENVHDAQMRLRGTVVLYKGDPVRVRDVAAGDGDSILRVLFEPLPLNAKKAAIDEAVEAAQRKYISSKHFDIAPFKMGYVNEPKGAFYCSRLPNRMQKQGLSAENFIAKDNYGRPVGFNAFLQTKEVVAMVRGDYPNFKTAMAALGKATSIAFSRNFCLEKDDIIEQLIHIYHRGEAIGGVLDGKVILGKKFQCLKESLEELGVKVG
jgi:hypothetical protein